VERNDAIERLPRAHALALALRDQGLDEDQIAQRLEIPREAVGPLMRIAEAKAAKLLDLERSGETGSGT
jgi:DNA-directed RNA polymerase specialized sigma24 family protein